MAWHIRTLVLVGCLAALAGCNPKPKPEAPGEAQAVPPANTDPAALALEKELDQGWTPANRAVWYEQTQGSRLVPLTWLLALEDADGKPLLSEDNVKKWGYLPHVNRQGRALPIGFTEDVTPDAKLPQPVLTWRAAPKPEDRIWVGMNCSACHTAQITYKDKTLTVDGGPALSNFEGFLGDLRASLDATETDKDRFNRFADRVLGEKPLTAWTPGPHPVEVLQDRLTTGPEDNKADRDLLRAALGKVAARERELARLNGPVAAGAGYGRLDAFGHIFNKVAWMARAPGQAPNPSNAPVSYPFMWNVPQHDRVQWNGIAKKISLIDGRDVGSVLRNAGEVVGVFADITIAEGQDFYPSSMNVPGLVALEQQITVLRPPAWPTSVFGWNETVTGPDGKAVSHDQLVADGKAIYADPQKGDCIACHKLLPKRTDLSTPIVAQMAMFNPKTKVGGAVHESAGTDIWMACNAYTKSASTGLFKGVPTTVGPVGDRADLALLLRLAVGGALARQITLPGLPGLQDRFAHPLIPPKIMGALIDRVLGSPQRASVPAVATATPEQRCLNEVSPILGYKARPLNGIWATAPYLHNGSVRTLYQLLRPADQREAAFEVGSREFDPKEVGYVNSDAANHTTLKVGAGAAIGDSNAGHDYGNAGLSDYDRWALIEYLKTL